MSDERKYDSKVCAKTIRVGARMDIASLVKASVEYIISKCDKSRRKHATGYRGAASATGYRGAASATGYWGAASATGDQGAASATGYQGAASATGNRGAVSATGYQGAASATGYQGAAAADNPTAIAVSWGIEGRAKGVLGAHIVCAEWQQGKLICAKMARVDGVVIKPDTYYTLINGEFVEKSV